MFWTALTKIPICFSESIWYFG